MVVLVINNVMDYKSQVLSWQIKVAYGLAQHFSKVIVLTQSQGEIGHKPDNVVIINFPSLAKPPFRWMGGEYLLNFWVAYLHSKYKFHRCFMHMNFKWAYRFAPFFKIHQIPVTFWYAHGATSRSLKLAHFFANKVLTSSAEGFRLASNKVVYIGQGIDTDIFNIPQHSTASSNILYVGRISPVKRIERLIEVINELVNNLNYKQFTLTIVGAPLNISGNEYLKEIEEKIGQLNLTPYVKLTGKVRYEEIPFFYNDAFVHLSFSETGSMDKTLLEALSAGCPVVTSNKSLFEIISKEDQVIEYKSEKVAQRVLDLYKNQNSTTKAQKRETIIKHHDFNNFVLKLRQEIINT
jgi:glycosyltransferase involved in cell wall biosynthesis